MPDTTSAAPSDADILALNAGGIYFSESPSKYPEAGHGTQYHAGTPGVLGFARVVLAKWGQPTPPAVVESLTDEQAKAVLWAEHLRWMEAAGLDTEGMQPTGEWLDHWLVYARTIEAAHGIGIKKENGNG